MGKSSELETQIVNYTYFFKIYNGQGTVRITGGKRRSPIGKIFVLTELMFQQMRDSWGHGWARSRPGNVVRGKPRKRSHNGG